jgi:hypothetical protein
LQNDEGVLVGGFHEIQKLHVNHFNNIHKAPKRENIEQIHNISSLFLSFVSKKDKQMMMEEVSKEKLKYVMASFQKDKSLRLDGWFFELFIYFYDIFEEEGFL